MKINVVGLGYIGLPTALCLATGGLEVVGTDVSKPVVDTLTCGELTFEEKGMPELFAKAKASKLSFSQCCVEADVYIVAVPTPYDIHFKKIDPSYVIKAVENVLDVAPKGAVIAVESTISPDTTDRHIRPIIANRGLKCGSDVHIAHVPERIIPGNMIHELENNNRTLGVDDEKTGEILKKVYSSFCKGDMVTTSIKVAEMTKVVENTSRDIQIAFANELARICNRENIDVYEVIRIANMHPRVNILNPGPGVGGHCISVDPWFLVGDYPDIVDIVMAARRVNSTQPSYVLEKTYMIMKENGISSIQDVGFYGLSYKEDVDDIRESPTLQMIEIMEKNLAFGAKVYDPYVKNSIVSGQRMDFDEFIESIKLLVIMVGHRHLVDNYEKIKHLLIYDTRHCVVGENVTGL